MMSFVEKPNLPSDKASLVVCGTDDELILNFFKKESIKVLKNDKNQNIDTAVASHVDMALLHLGYNKILIDKGQKSLKNILSKHGFKIFETETEIKGSYPNDVKLNVIISGNKVMCNLKYCDSAIHNLLPDKRFIHVNQGYSKCSVLVVNEDAIITDDESVYRKTVNSNVDCLLVSKGDVSLDGHQYGFIGGASGKIKEDTVVFFGDITKHRDFDKINTFLSRHNCSFVCTDTEKLRDIGGIVPLIENLY